ncbi:MAG: hypothetical protein ACRDSZ_17470 [Pseudonocardiaceae bacterium]
MKIAEIFQLGYGHDRGGHDDYHGRKHHKDKYRGGHHYRRGYDRHDDDGLLIKIRLG